MANILETLFPTRAFDRVAVFDQSFNQIFPRARPIKAIVKEEAKVMEHPLESGATITDHRVILPIEIELSFIIQAQDYQDTYLLMRQYYLNATLLVVQTNANTYYNQLIASMPHEENPELYDALQIILTLKEAQFATTIYDFSPTNVKQSSEVNRGAQQSQNFPSSPSNNTFALSAFNYAKNLFGG